MKKFQLLVFIFSAIWLFSSCNDNHIPLRVKYVFSDINLKTNEAKYPRNDYYYVFNYKERDSTVLIKMLDTLSIDSIYPFHGISFYKYDGSMPDT